MTTPAPPVLMSSDNPDGWKLDDLLAVLIEEVSAKSLKILDDPTRQARAVLTHNQQIILNLKDARRLQVESMRILEAIGPNQGPRGTPRIGPGSHRP